MPPFSKFLVCAAEGSGGAATRYATRLAAESGATVTLADVLETVPAGVLRRLPAGWDVPRLVREQKAVGLERAAATVRRAGITPKVTLLKGSPVDALVAEVQRGKHDLLIVGAPTGDAVNAGHATASRLVRQAPCPVLLVHPARRRRHPRVLAAVDATPLRGAHVDALTRQLMAAALWATGLLGAELHVLHVWESFGERQMRRAGLSPADLREYRATARHNAAEELERTLAPFAGDIASDRIHLQKGDARDVIPSFAIDNDVDLLVIGTVARSGISRFVIGNTAEAVLARLPCSMLVVRPAKPR